MKEGENYTKPFPPALSFENYINNEANKKWMREHWHYSFYISIVYLITIFSLQNYMHTRPPYKLKPFTIVWNMILAFYSILTVVRETPVLIQGINDFSFNFIVCDVTLVQRIPQCVFYGWLFIYSKLFELGDTLLIVLRKKKLVFLHWYHHVVTLILVWFLTSREVSIGGLVAYTNGAVHSFMYSYFALKAMNVNVPRPIAMFITIIQTSQMLFGVYLSFYAYGTIQNGGECDAPKDALEYAFLVYLSYFCLFCRLFYTSYLAPALTYKKIV